MSLLATVMLLAPIAIIASSGPAEAADIDYLGRRVQVTAWDGTEAGGYGYWTFDDSGYDVSSVEAYLRNSYTDESVQGNASMNLQYTCWGPGALADDVALYYKFHTYPGVSISRLDSMSFYYKGDSVSNDNIRAVVQIYVNDSQGNVLRNMLTEIPLDAAWHKYTLERMNQPGAASIEIWFVLVRYEMSLADGTAYLMIDDMTAESPMSQVRFSFFNEYTGLGQTSELLIPELWWDGVWYRVWNNEISVAQGELVAYRVTDYFDQVVTMSEMFMLRNATEYIDVPVKLVKVHIERPQWWTSDLPPEWYLTYLPSGKALTTSGWDIEVLAGWYSFRWPDQTVSPPAGNGTAGAAEGVRYIVQNGSIDQQVEGNVSTASSFVMTDFFLQMSPTLQETYDYGEGTVQEANLWSFGGLSKTIGVIVDAVQNELIYKVLITVVGVVTIITVFWGWTHKAAVKAQLVREGNH